MPPFSGKIADSSAATNAVGIKKMIAERTKKKMSSLPNRADAGRLRMLSMAAMMSKTREKREIFFCIIIPFYRFLVFFPQENYIFRVHKNSRIDISCIVNDRGGVKI